MDKNKTKHGADHKWEEEGRPGGQADRHRFEAQKESEDDDLPKTWSSDHAGGVIPPSEGAKATSDTIPSNQLGTFMPGELASENK